MDNFLRYFYMDIGQVFQALVDLVVAIGNFLNYLLNFPMRMNAIKAHYEEFNTLDWILVLAVNLALLVIVGLMVYGIIRLLKKLLRFRISPKQYDEMAKQVRNLQRDLLRANYEKDKLLAMRVAEVGLEFGQKPEGLEATAALAWSGFSPFWTKRCSSSFLDTLEAETMRTARILADICPAAVLSASISSSESSFPV